MIEIIDLNNSLKWDEIVKSFSVYEVYYLSGYVKAFYIHGDGIPKLVYLHNKNTRAIQVIFLRKISECKHYLGIKEVENLFDTITPYGYGGFIFDNNSADSRNDNNELLCEYDEYCKNNNIVCEFVRFSPFLSNENLTDNFYKVLYHSKTIAIDLKNNDTLWENFTSKNRNTLRRAMRHDMQILVDNNESSYIEFERLYILTMKKDNANEYYFFNKNFFESIRNDLKDNSIVFYAVFEGKVVASAIFLFANNGMHYHLSASDAEYRNLDATNLILLRASEWGIEKGFKFLHLGGGVGALEDSLFHFKKVFNKNSDLNFATGQKVFLQEYYNKLIALRNEERFDDGFFPQYRR